MSEESPLTGERVDALLRQFHDYLETQQLRSTRQRDIVAKTFFALDGHVNVDELLAHARRESPRLGYATVYRTLKLLTECGLAAERRFGNDSRVYETAGDTAHHDHLICVECGHVLEFENEEIENEEIEDVDSKGEEEEQGLGSEEAKVEEEGAMSSPKKKRRRGVRCSLFAVRCSL